MFSPASWAAPPPPPDDAVTAIYQRSNVDCRVKVRNPLLLHCSSFEQIKVNVGERDCERQAVMVMVSDNQDLDS